VAGENLHPSQRVEIINNEVFATKNNVIGIVDPFLDNVVCK